MRIAHLIPTFLPHIGGAEACVHNLARSQAAAGHLVKVITPKRGNVADQGYGILPLARGVARFPDLPFVKRYFLNALSSYQTEHLFDIWQVTIGYPFGVMAVDFFNARSIPCVLRCSGADIQTEPSLGYGVRLDKGRDAEIRRSYQKFDAVVSIVESIAADLADIGVPAAKIHRIQNGVNLSAFDIEPDRQGVKRSLGIGAGKRVIVTVGKNRPKKGLDRIPVIIEAVSKRCCDFVWVVVGAGSRRLKEAARERGVGEFIVAIEGLNDCNDNVPFELPTRRLVEIYKSADLFVFPTYIEGGCNVVTEAMAAGLPFVSTDVPGIRDLVGRGRTGLLSERGDTAGMAGNILRLFEDRGLYNKMKEAALSSASHLDWPTVSKRYLALYERVINSLP